MPKGVHSVSSLTFVLKDVVEGRFSRVAVEGEVVGARHHASGHLYFALKDPRARLECVVWRSTAQRLPLRITDGMQLIAHGDIQLYAPQGRYQLIVHRVIEAGLGSLLARLEQLKGRLAAEGLFDANRKHPLPAVPRRIGVVTAPGGAALHDILTTLAARLPTPVLLYPCRVQGRGAAQSIARGIEQLATRPRVDVIIAGRGGGSLEDLWAFNEEIVVRAIARSPVPVVSAVGHEIDTVLSDLAADRRAPTPTAAAELVVPTRRGLEERIAGGRHRLAAAARRRVVEAKLRARATTSRLGDPQRLVAERQQALDELKMRLTAAIERRLFNAQRTRAAIDGRLRNLHPRARLGAARARLTALETRAARAAGQTLRVKRGHVAELARTLRAVGPAASLERGYAIVRTPAGQVLRAADETRPGAQLEVIFHRGGLGVTVDETRRTNVFEPENA